MRLPFPTLFAGVSSRGFLALYFFRLFCGSSSSDTPELLLPSGAEISCVFGSTIVLRSIVGAGGVRIEVKSFGCTGVST